MLLSLIGRREWAYLVRYSITLNPTTQLFLGSQAQKIWARACFTVKLLMPIIASFIDSLIDQIEWASQVGHRPTINPTNQLYLGSQAQKIWASACFPVKVLMLIFWSVLLSAIFFFSNICLLSFDANLHLASTNKCESPMTNIFLIKIEIFPTLRICWNLLEMQTTKDDLKGFPCWRLNDVCVVCWRSQPKPTK